jgi:hypothetical protein
MNYTERLLGFPQDKLLAMSALVKHMVTLSVLQGEDMVYVAGMPILLNDEMSWADQLLWYTLDVSRTSRSRDYRAPSWSWTAVDGPCFRISTELASRGSLMAAGRRRPR